MFADQSNPDYTRTGRASLDFQIINQRADVSFALFTGGLANVCFLNTLNFELPFTTVPLIVTVWNHSQR